ncbi:VanZ family protein [Filobacillus milosensis]|nr:VanZ family protein [Filobacillus milosensis]
MIELTQYLTAREALDIDDLIINLTGVIIGFLIFPYVFKKTVVMTGGERNDLKR